MAQPMTLASGVKLGPYEIQSALGAGGMGEVYLARDTRLDRTVAIKILASHLSSSPELKQRMEREARAISHRDKCFSFCVLQVECKTHICLPGFICLPAFRFRTAVVKSIEVVALDC